MSPISKVIARTILALGIAAVLPAGAWAHSGHSTAPTAWNGMLHPLSGADHLLAMVATGLLAAKLGAGSWRVPVTFVLMMAVGAVFGLGHPSALIEASVALSISCLGLLLLMPRSVSVIAAASVAGLFGFLHGWAHGSEMPASSASVAFLGGALVSTAAVHLIGLLLGRSINTLAPAMRLRGWYATGGAFVAAGVAVLAA